MTYRYSFETDEKIVSCDTCPCLEYDTGRCHLREEMEITDENLKNIYRGLDEPEDYACPASCPLHETEVQRHESLAYWDDAKYYNASEATTVGAIRQSLEDGK